MSERLSLLYCEICERELAQMTREFDERFYGLPIVVIIFHRIELAGRRQSNLNDFSYCCPRIVRKTIPVAALDRYALRETVRGWCWRATTVPGKGGG